MERKNLHTVKFMYMTPLYVFTCLKRQSKDRGGHSMFETQELAHELEKFGVKEGVILF